MSDLSRKLSDIAEEERRLEERRKKLIEDQKMLISGLVEQCGLLFASEQVLVGAFTEIADAIAKNDARVITWQNRGAAISSAPKKRGRKPKVVMPGGL